MTSWIVSEDVLAQQPLIRDATRSDVSRIVEIYRQDELTRKHNAPAEPGVPSGYYATFAAIDADPRNRLLVAELGGVVVGTFQLTLLPDMSPDGRETALVENVAVEASLRGRGIGSFMMRWAIDEARRLNCGKISLTSNKARTDAHRFYERLGFGASHEGFKIYFEE